MSNAKSKRRSVKSAQLHMREIVIFLDQATDAVSGPDKLLVEGVTDLGAGQHLIVLKGKAQAVYGKSVFLKGFSSVDADVTVQVLTADKDRITIQAKQAGADADSDLVLTIGVHDWKHEYEA